VLELMSVTKCEHAVHLAGIDSVVVRNEIAWFVLELLRGDNMDTIIHEASMGPIADMEAIKVARNVLAALKVTLPRSRANLRLSTLDCLWIVSVISKWM